MSAFNIFIIVAMVACMAVANASAVVAKPAWPFRSTGVTLTTKAPTIKYGAKLSDETKVLKVIFKLLKIDADPATCMSDSTGAAINFKDFANEFESKSYESAIASLSKAFSGLSSSISDCGVPQVVHSIDALAIATKFAKISSKLDGIDSIMIGASELVHDVEALAAAAKSGDNTAIATSIGTFLADWTQVTGGCGDHKGCKLIGGVLRIIQEVATDITPCKEALLPAVNQMESAVTSFKGKDYKAAVKDLADSLETVAVTLKNKSCGLTRIGDLVGKLSPKLAAAVIKVEDSKAVQIIVGAADVYDDVFQLVQAVEGGDWTTVGEELANLLRVLRASGCDTKACIVLEGLMASVQKELENFDACMGDANAAWADLETGMSDFKNHNYKNGIHELGSAVVTLAHAIKDCNVEGVSEVAENMFNKIHDNTIANDIGDVVQLLVQGADVTLDINRAVQDFGGKNWASFGSDLGSLAEFLNSTKCQSVTCKIVEGLLNAAGIAFQDLKACETDLKHAVSGYTEGAQLFEQRNFKGALKTWSTALSQTSAAVSDCGLKKELGYIQQEANLLGYANVTVHTGIVDKIERDFSVLMHGFDYVGDLTSVYEDIRKHDYSGAGADLHSVVSDMAAWTGKFACNSDLCYTIMGVLTFIGDMSGSIKTCENDFKSAWTDFGDGVADFHDSHHNIIFHFKHDKNAIHAGLKAFGAGFHQISAAVGDCHLEEFAKLLEDLAVKLGLAPEIKFFEELLHILIEGKKVSDEIGDACDAYSSKNFPGFGFNLARLLKTLL